MHKIFLLPHDVFEDEKFKKLRLSSKYFYCYLAKLKNQYQDCNGWFWCKMTQLSLEMDMNLKTVKRAKKELLQNNFIEVRRGTYQGTNRRCADYYRVLGFPCKPTEELEMLRGSGHLGCY